MKIISNAYEGHIWQGWNLIFTKVLNNELESAQDIILSQQEIVVSRTSKGLYGRLLSQMQGLVANTLKKKQDDRMNSSKVLDEMVSAEEIEEFYKYKFNNVSKELHENINSLIIGYLKQDMVDLQNEIIATISKDIVSEFMKIQQ